MLRFVIALPLALVGFATLAQALVGGSYRRSCDGIRQQGPYLSAICRNVNGEGVETSIDVRGCRGGVANVDGRLSCGRGGPRHRY